MKTMIRIQFIIYVKIFSDVLKGNRLVYTTRSAPYGHNWIIGTFALVR